MPNPSSKPHLRRLLPPLRGSALTPKFCSSRSVVQNWVSAVKSASQKPYYGFYSTFAPSISEGGSFAPALEGRELREAPLHKTANFCANIYFPRNFLRSSAGGRLPPLRDPKKFNWTRRIPRGCVGVLFSKPFKEEVFAELFSKSDNAGGRLPPLHSGTVIVKTKKAFLWENLFYE